MVPGVYGTGSEPLTHVTWEEGQLSGFAAGRKEGTLRFGVSEAERGIPWEQTKPLSTTYPIKWNPVTFFPDEIISGTDEAAIKKLVSSN